MNFTSKMPPTSSSTGFYSCRKNTSVWTRCLGNFTRATLYINLQEERRAMKGGHALCASLRSQTALGDFTRATLYGNLQVKCCATKAGHTLFASPRSRNALGDCTRAASYGNLEVKCRRPAGSPWSSTGLYSYRQNPSVWTRCLVK